MEKEYARLYEDIGIGLTTFSPLASGLLTGKYQDGIPQGSRGDQVEWLQETFTDEERLARVADFIVVAQEVGCSPAQLALAWTASNPHVSSVIVGARSVDQLSDNLAALEVMDALPDDHKQRINEIFS